MSIKYTPTTGEVKRWYALGQEWRYSDRIGEVDRWLDAHDRELREQIAADLRRNRIAHVKTEYSQGYKDGYNDAADHVEHGGGRDA